MLLQDLRFAVRSLVHQPLFAAVAIGTLALAIGANVAIFSVVRGVLLRPLPYPDGERLVQVRSVDRREGPGNLSPADYFDFERETATFARLGAHGYVGAFTIDDGRGDAERLGGVNVTDGFFATLGIQPALGRGLTREDDRPDAPRVMLISHALWVRRFNADPSVVGRAVRLNARPTTVVGILPAAFRHIETNPDRAAEIFVPYQFDRANANRGGHFIRGVGRLAPGRSVEQARAELAAIAARLERQHPVENTGRGVLVTPLLDAMVSDARTALVVLLSATGLVLVVGCANLANLLLARGAARRRELAVRAALGAGRGRLVRQMLTESIVLAAGGAVCGVAFGVWATRVLATLAASSLPRSADIGVDGVVLGFAAGIAALSSVLVGLLPALQLSRRDLHDTLKEGGRQPSAAMRTSARDALIIAEAAVSVVLLVGAGLFARSLWNLQHVDPGFAAERVVTMEVALPVARYEEGSQMPFYARLLARVSTLSGVEAAGAINILPLSANYDSRGVQIEDAPKPAGQGESIQARSVTPGYFAAMGMPVVAGRSFDARDDERGALVTIVSQSMAERYWPGQDVLGRRITFNSGIPREAQQEVGGPGSRVIVGVVGDVKHLGLDEAVVPMFYTPHTQQPSYHTMALVVRARAIPSALAGAIRGELSQMDPGVPLSQTRALSGLVDASVAQPRLRALLLGVFAGLALLLASLGVYGVVGYLVSQRRHEMGVRIALGAGRRDVLRLLLTQGLRPVILGAALGTGLSLAVSRVLAAMLFRVGAADLLTYAVAAGVLVASALVATLVPARRALRIDPAVTLRE